MISVAWGNTEVHCCKPVAGVNSLLSFANRQAMIDHNYFLQLDWCVSAYVLIIQPL